MGAALSNSTHRYAWKPQNEYSYRYESSIEFSIPQIKADQKSGLKLAAIIKVQAQTDYSLLIQLSQPRFLTFNGLAGEEIEETIPEAFKTHLETAFKVEPFFLILTEKVNLMWYKSVIPIWNHLKILQFISFQKPGFWFIEIGTKFIGEIWSGGIT